MFETSFGPLQSLVDDPSIAEILVCAHDDVRVVREGQLETADVAFTSHDQYTAFARQHMEALTSTDGVPRPVADASVAGLRVTFAMPPVTEEPLIVIRRPLV